MRLARTLGMLALAMMTMPSLAAAQARPRTIQSTAAGSIARDSVYSELQVEQPAEPVADNKLPDFPLALRQAGIEGNVVAQFVVRPDGTVDRTSVRIMSSSHPGFVDPVRDAIPALRYQPARIHGRAVSQLVQQPFVFSLNR